MTGMQPEDDFSKGMQTIESAITNGVWATGRHLTSANFTWHRGRAVMMQPDKTDLQIRIGHRTIVAVFVTQEIADSADRINRPETIRTVARIISEAGQSRR